eukprot:Pgem_evm1s17876
MILTLTTRLLPSVYSVWNITIPEAYRCNILPKQTLGHELLVKVTMLLHKYTDDQNH